MYFIGFIALSCKNITPPPPPVAPHHASVRRRGPVPPAHHENKSIPAILASALLSTPPFAYLVTILAAHYRCLSLFPTESLITAQTPHNVLCGISCSIFNDDTQCTNVHAVHVVPEFNAVTTAGGGWETAGDQASFVPSCRRTGFDEHILT